VELEAYPGEILGIVGPNGAGKTTLFQIVSGFLRPTAGEVWLEGRRIDGLRPSAIARLGIGRTFQQSRVFGRLTVLQNVLVAVGRDMWSNPLRSLVQRPAPTELAAAREALAELGLEPYSHVPAGDLPLGWQRRVEVARALALRPRVLLLDEPLAGLSQEEAREVVRTVQGLAHRGLAVLLVEHNVAVTLEVCARVAVLASGRKIAEGTPEEVRANPEVIAAYLGTQA